jgi:hypothetical protein
MFTSKLYSARTPIIAASLLSLVTIAAAAACGPQDGSPGFGETDDTLALGTKTQALDATAATDDKSITVPTASYWYTGVTPAFIADRLSALGTRLTNLEVDPSDTSKFTVTMVKNSGAYAVSGWWWYYGLTAAEVSERISTLSARPIDLQKYDTPSGARFAVVLVANTGAQARGFWYFHDVTSAYLSDQLTAHGARLTSLKTRVVGGQTVHTAIMIPNAGSDAIGWWWYLNVTPAFVAQKLGDNGARLIDYERRANGNLDVVMVQHEGAYSFWFYGLTSPSEVNEKLGQLVARPIEVEKYLEGGSPRYAVLMLDNASPETRRIERMMAPGLASGGYGAYLKRVGGSPSLDVNSGFVFDPASSLKVVYEVYAMQHDHAILDTANAFSYWVKPTDPTNKDVCPDPAWETNANLVQTTVRTGATNMMQISDNRATRGFQKRYGQATINTFMDSVGMAGSQIRQMIGCGYDNGLKNDVTLADLGRVYEGVADGSLLSGTPRTDFYNILLGGPVSSTSALADVVREEATALGKSASVASQFISEMSTRSKGGSYDICGSSGCGVSYTYTRSVGGRIVLPYMVRGVLTPTEFVYGRFASDVNIPCSPKMLTESVATAEARCPAYKAANDALNESATEMFRAEIRKALQTF